MRDTRLLKIRKLKGDVDKYWYSIVLINQTSNCVRKRKLPMPTLPGWKRQPISYFRLCVLFKYAEITDYRI